MKTLIKMKDGLGVDFGADGLGVVTKIPWVRECATSCGLLQGKQHFWAGVWKIVRNVNMVFV